ncbi:hypothetical protein FGB62_332g03 [Gracilaria domingensis]|nr:hypothetical protein FGB62_332g03 [Gracilaria domingensis]
MRNAQISEAGREEAQRRGIEGQHGTLVADRALQRGIPPPPFSNPDRCVTDTMMSFSMVTKEAFGSPHSLLSCLVS